MKLHARAERHLIDLANICREEDATAEEKRSAFDTIREICFPSEPIDLSDKQNLRDLERTREQYTRDAEPI